MSSKEPLRVLRKHFSAAAEGRRRRRGASSLPSLLLDIQQVVVEKKGIDISGPAGILIITRIGILVVAGRLST